MSDPLYTDPQRAEIHKQLVHLALEGKKISEVDALGIVAPSTLRKLWYEGHYTKTQRLAAVKTLVEQSKTKKEFEAQERRIAELQRTIDLNEKEKQAVIEAAKSQQAIEDARLQQQIQEEKDISKAIISTAKTNSIQCLAISSDLLRRAQDLTEVWNRSVEGWLKSYGAGGVIPRLELAAAQKLIRENVRIAKDAHYCARLTAETQRLMESNDPEKPTTILGINVRVHNQDQVDTNIALAQRNRERELRKARKNGMIIDSESVAPVINTEYNSVVGDQEEYFPDGDLEEGLTQETEGSESGEDGDTAISSGESGAGSPL